MTHPAYLREKSRQLRITKRLTIDELAERLALSRTTIYYWVRDLPIPGSGPGGGWPKGAQRKGSRAMQAKYRRLREAAYEDGLRTFSELARDPTFRDFICMYIGEGFKRNRNRVLIANSDPAVIRLADRWMRRLADKPLLYGVQYHADQNLALITEFWAIELGIDAAEIRLQRKSNSNQLNGRTWRSRHGVLTIWANDTMLRARLQAWMDALKATWLEPRRSEQPRSVERTRGYTQP